MKSVAIIFLVAIMFLAIIPGYDIFADKPDNVEKSKFAITVKEIKEPKIVQLADGRIAEKIVYLSYKEEFSHKESHAEEYIPGEGCYAVAFYETEWKNPENYIVDATNTNGLSKAFVKDTFAASIASWNNVSPSTIFGAEVDRVADGMDTGNVDGKNEVMFVSVDDSSLISSTIIWAIYTPSPQFREIVEWDTIFNEAYDDWGDADVESGIMDLQNAATHEFGHAAGLNHIDTNTCTNQTMYDSLSLGETKKRSLNAGDIYGINVLYG